MFLTGDEVLTG